LNRLPAISGKTMEKALVSIGFEPVRTNGSHVFYRHPDGRTTTVPHHAGRDLARPLLREILREIEMKPDELVGVLNSI